MFPYTKNLIGGVIFNKFKFCGYPPKFYKNNFFFFCSGIYNSWKDVKIPLDKIEVNFSRSGGAGGQNVNKLNTKVEFRFNLEKADWLDDYTKSRIKELFPNKINSEGDFFLTSQEHRTQEQNRKEAQIKLQYLIFEASIPKKERIIEPFKENEHQKDRRISEKKMRSKVKSMRRGEE